MKKQSNNTQWTRNFNSDEFKCACCGYVIDNPKVRFFVSRLQEARDNADTPFIITSGYRCAAHNSEVGGAADSSHIKGIAADIKCNNIYQRIKIVEGLIRAGFKRIGIHEYFIHCDLDYDKPNCFWMYKTDKNGRTTGLV